MQQVLVIICYMSTKVELEEGEGRGKVLVSLAPSHPRRPMHDEA